MSPTTTAGKHAMLTSRQLEERPEEEKPKPLPLLDPWPTRHSVSFATPSVERAVPICRRLALLWLDAEQIHDEDTRYTVVLVMSELITNAIRHSKSSCISSRLWTSGDLLFVEVRDQGGTLSVPRVDAPDVSKDHGRGLALVAQSAWGWGRHLDADGSCAVWAAVPLTPSAWEETNCRR